MCSIQLTTVPLMDGQKIAAKTEVHKIETAIVQYSIDGMTDSRRNMHAKTTVHKIETAIVQYSIDTAIVIAVTRSSTFSVAP